MGRKTTPRPHPPGRLSLAVRGGVVATVVVAILVYITIASTGALSGYPEVTATVPASNAGAREQAAVEYKGVVVGKIISVETKDKTSTVTLRIYDRQAAGIPKTAMVRVLPRTLFGDQYIQLVPPETAGGPGLEDGDVLRADMSKGTIQLYHAYVRLTELLQQVRPAEIATALGAMAQLLDGRGEKFGRMIDQLYDITGEVPELLELVDDGMDVATTLSEQLAAATPDGIRAMRNAIALSETIVAEKQTLRRVLAAGISLTGEGERFLADNTDRFVELMNASGPAIDTLAENPQGVPNAIRAARKLLTTGIPAFSTGPWFKIRASLQGSEPNSYVAPRDCPRYGSLAGPNCGGSARAANYGGTSGSVGSPQERETLRELARLAPGGSALTDDADGLLGVLVGPMVRGTQVITR